MSKLNEPVFICIGAQRAGTTWLHMCLKEHPEIFLPEEKEIHFFDRFYEKGWQWYLNKFSQADGKVCGEITPNYYQADEALDRIKQDLPEIKILYILREPVSRARSQFQLFAENRYKGRTFEDVLEHESIISELSKQGKHLQKLNNLFNKKQILVLFYDELANSPETFLDRVFKFLSVDPNFKPTHLNKRINRIVLPKLQERLRKLRLGWLINLIKKSPLAETIKSIFHSKKQEKSTTNKFTSRFAQDIKIIEAELNINLSRWKN